MGFSLKAGSTVLVESVDCSAARGVGDKGIQLFVHALLREVHLDIVLSCELLDERLSRVVVELDAAKANSLHNSLSGFECLVALDLAAGGQAVDIERGGGSKVGVGSGGVLC